MRSAETSTQLLVASRASVVTSRWVVVLIATVLVFWAVPCNAVAQDVQRPAPPVSIDAKDVRNDAGRQLDLHWKISPDDSLDHDPPRVVGYRIYRAKEGEEFNMDRPIFDERELFPQMMEITDERLTPNQRYIYRITAIGPDEVESDFVEMAASVAPVRWWFDRNKSWFLLLTALISFWIAYFIYLARSGSDLKIRKIAGLEAVDEAVGRATEMGRPILFVPGIQDMNNIQTVAGITVLSRIGKMTAEYDARIEVPTSRSLVMTTARETLESSYLSAGRPDAYHEDMSYYVTDEQFGYVAYLAGYMSREKPAACFYLGAFFAESLILAETGNSIGAIQVAGTAEPAQLPFFVAACDYTLIGEEFFAASAYLSGEPEQLGTLKGQDVGKLIGGSLIIIGCLMFTFAQVTESEGMQRAVNYLMFQMLGTEDVPEEMIEADLGAADEDADVVAEDGGYESDEIALKLETEPWRCDAASFYARQRRSMTV